MITELMMQRSITSLNVSGTTISRKKAGWGAKFFLAPCFCGRVCTISWEQRKLGDIAVEVKRKADKDSDAPVMMISASEGFIDQSQRYSNNNAGSSLKNYTLLYEGELAYNHGYSKFRNFGSVFDLKVEKARIPFVYHSFALPEDDHRFYAYYLNSGLFDGELKKLVSSTARMDGLLNISYEDYMSIPILHPQVEEQKKIGEYLTSLDHLITLHQREAMNKGHDNI